MPDPEIQETLLEHVRRYHKELIADRALSWESEAIIALLRIHEKTGLDGVLVKEIAAEMNLDWESGESVSAKKVGWILRSKLHLKADRTGRGFCLSISRNQERIDLWKERLGITDTDIKGEVNDVNVVNITENEKSVETDIRPEDIPF